MIPGPNWARRYGPNHRRLCARPGCGTPAAATLRFQPTQREAWLVDLDDDDARTEGDLCARHAAGLVLPRGWQLHNDLSAQRDDSQPPTPPVRRARASIARARRRRSATTAVSLPGLSAVTDPKPAVEPEVPTATATATATEVAEPAIAPLVAEATPETTVELAETLDAQTPLLRRAFSNVLPTEDDG
jgi:hypothetical protein